MTPQDKSELANILQVLCDLDRYSGCSDRYFRQVFSQRVAVIKAFNYIDQLRAEADANNREDD